jgi:hypothetical protein
MKVTFKEKSRWVSGDKNYRINGAKISVSLSEAHSFIWKREGLFRGTKLSEVGSREMPIIPSDNGVLSIETICE